MKIVRGHKCFATGRRNETQAPVGVKPNVAARIAAANAGRNTEYVVSVLKTNPNCTQVRLGAVLLPLLPIMLYLEKVPNIFSPWELYVRLICFLFFFFSEFILD